MKKNLAIGADIGGSHISCAAIDLVSKRILRETLIEMKVDNQAPADEIISVWTEALLKVLSKVASEKVRGIGFAMPSPFDYVKGICYIKGVSKYENLYGLNITDAILNQLGISDNFLIRYINDASAFAIGENMFGSALNTKRSLSITLGTGFGSAFIKDSIPIVDGPNIPKLGCLFHLPYKDGIADDYFSTRWFIGRYKKLAKGNVNDVKELAEMAACDNDAYELFVEFGINLAQFLAPWLKKFNAEILVVGGNISNAYNIFGEVFEEYLRMEKCTSNVALSMLKEESALLGSAYLLDNAFWKSIQHVLPLM